MTCCFENSCYDYVTFEDDGQKGSQKANRAIKLSQCRRERIYDPIELKLGDVLRWNYTKEVGVVVGFDSGGGIIVHLNDETEIIFESDPKLFEKVEGEG